jgi:hypothetical protein
MRLLGYYKSPNQTMKPEEAYIEQAKELASLLCVSLNSIKYNDCSDDFMKNAISEDAVFIFKDERNKLYAYFSGTNIARITNVFFSKKAINQVPLKYKRWFYPGNNIELISEKMDKQPTETKTEDSNIISNSLEDSSFDWTNFIDK